MAKHILKCNFCNIYTLKSKCSICEKETVIPRPAKHSPSDKYGNYRRIAKMGELKKKKLY